MRNRRGAYEKLGTTGEERKSDVADCTQASIGHEPGRHVLAPVVIDRTEFEKCLTNRGYSRTR